MPFCGGVGSADEINRDNLLDGYYVNIMGRKAPSQLFLSVSLIS